MSKANNRLVPKFLVDRELTLQERSVTALRASLMPEWDKAIAAATQAIRLTELSEQLDRDTKSILVGAFRATLTELREMDPSSLTDAASLDDAARRIRSLSSGGCCRGKRTG